MAYCFQTAQSLSFAVQLRLTPELKQALINARTNGDAVSLRFREEPNREAILSIAGQEHFFSTAPQAGQVEVVEVATRAKSAVSMAAVKQRLTLQRGLEPDARPRGLASGLPGGMLDDRRKRGAVLLDGSQRGGGVHPRKTTTTELVTRTTPQPSSQSGGAGTTNGRLSANGTGSLRPTHGSTPPGPRTGANGIDGSLSNGPPRKPMELPKPRSRQPGGGTAKPLAAKPRKTPTPPPPDVAAASAGAATAADGVRTGGGSGGGSGSGGGGSSPVGCSAAAGGGGGSGGGSAAAASATPAAVAAPPPSELPRTAVLAARRGDLSLVLAALLRDQPLTASSLQSRVDAAYRAAGVKPEAREYMKRVIDNCCTMNSNRMHLKPEVLSREGPRLDELVSGTSPSAGDTPFAAGATVATVAAAAGGAAASKPAGGRAGPLKRMASCSPDPRLSPDQDPSPGARPMGRSNDDQTISVGTADDDDDVSHHHHSAAAGTAKAARHGQAGAKRQKTAGPSGGGGAPPPPGAAQQARQAVAAGRAAGAMGGGGGGSGLHEYDDFDDLSEPAVLSVSVSAREVSSGKPPAPSGPNPPPGRPGAAAAGAGRPTPPPAAAAKKAAPPLSSGGPRGLPSFAPTPSTAAANGTASAQPQSQSQPGPQPSVKARPASGVAGAAAGARPAGKDSGSGRAGSLSPVARHASAAPAPSGRAASKRTASDDAPATIGGRGAGTACDGRVETGAPAPGVAAGAASPDCTESALDPEILAYAELELQEEDRDADWYRSYVDWKPQPHAAVQSYEHYEQYEREYRDKFEVYHRLNQKYNEVVREADAQRAAVDAAMCAEERRRCVMALWRLGASKWKLLEVWKQVRRNLHADLGDLRERVAEYLAQQASR